jgi:DNA-damage-inducible protein J
MNMANTVLNVRVDEALKKSFDEFCANVGMNASVAVNLFMRTVTRERRIPFEITDLHEHQVNRFEQFFTEIDAIDNEPISEEDIAEMLANRPRFSQKEPFTL